MKEQGLERYSRHILLPEIDMAGQEAISRSRVMIVGLGGLGSPVAMYLTAAGVGELTIVDHDVVDVSNLQRQVMHCEKFIGCKKVDSASALLAQINSAVRIISLDKTLSEAELLELLPKRDLLIDCSDNLETRLLLNRVCLLTGTPLVSGAAIRFEGQVSVFDFRDSGSPCYQCFNDIRSERNLTCSESGVFAPLVGVVGSIQALEALKLLSGMGSSLNGKLVLFDGRKNQWRYLKLDQDIACVCCGSTSGKSTEHG